MKSADASSARAVDSCSGMRFVGLLCVAVVLVVVVLAASACASPRSVVRLPPCADRVELEGQHRRLSARTIELDHTFDLPFSKTELTFTRTGDAGGSRGATRRFVLENDQPEPIRSF